MSEVTLTNYLEDAEFTIDGQKLNPDPSGGPAPSVQISCDSNSITVEVKPVNGGDELPSFSYHVTHKITVPSGATSFTICLPSACSGEIQVEPQNVNVTIGDSKTGGK